MVHTVLIADDSEMKRGDVVNYMQKIFPDANVLQFKNANEIMCDMHERREIMKQDSSGYVVVLDNSMPMFVGDRINKDASKRVLREMKRMGFNCPVIIESTDILNVDEYSLVYKNVVGTVIEDTSTYNLDAYAELLCDYME